MQVQEFFALDKFNTFGLKSQARYYLRLDDVNDFKQLYAWMDGKNLDFLVLGGGSNVILPEKYAGLVIHNAVDGLKMQGEDSKHVCIEVGAGVVWDDLVAKSVSNGWYGLENLSLIPGTVGASPIQNIGAYGVEVKDFIEYVEIFDIMTGRFIKFSNDECKFSYRDSIFKYVHNYIVVKVAFRLNKVAELKLDYGDIRLMLKDKPNPTALDLRNCVIAIRQSKLPNPAVIGNVGSFFHNPKVARAVAEALKQRYPEMPLYVTEESVKLSAGWLIDNLGLKGYKSGNVGIYDKQALVIVNYGAATQTEVLGFAHMIQQKVLAAYEISLNIEPLVIQ